MQITTEMYDAINSLFLEIYAKAYYMKPIGEVKKDAIELQARSNILNELDLKQGDYLQVGVGFDYDLKIVENNNIEEIGVSDNSYNRTSYIWIVLIDKED